MLPRSLTASGFREIGVDDPRFPTRVHRLQRRDADFYGLPIAIEHALTGIAFLLIPGGRFRVGAREGDLFSHEWERPIHRPKMKPFYLGLFPVTQEQWRRVVSKNPSKFRGKNRPVDSVSFFDALEFLRMAGSDLRLPIGVEWEKAARGGTRGIYWWGDEFRPDLVNCRGGTLRRRGPGGTSDVTKATPNPFGLLDMLGNVSEWVQDNWAGHHPSSRLGGESWEVNEAAMGVVCGGSWRDPAILLRCSERLAWTFSDGQPFLGFRVARDILIVNYHDS